MNNLHISILSVSDVPGMQWLAMSFSVERLLCPGGELFLPDYVAVISADHHERIPVPDNL